MGEGLDQLAGRDVLVGEDLVDRADRALRHAGRVERGADLVAAAGRERAGELRHHLVAAAQAAAVALQVRIAAPGFEAERLAQRRPVLVARRDVQVAAVRADEARRRHAAGMLGAEPRRHFAEREVARGREREQRDLAVEHGEVDVRAASARASRPESPARMAIAIHRPDVRSATGRPGFTGGPAALAGQAHDAAHRLEDGVVALAVRVRSALAEAGAGDVDDAAR